MRTGRPKGTVHTEATMYASMKRFVLAEGRLPTVQDYAAQAHGLPSNSSTMYRHCKHFKTLLAKDGITYRYTPRCATTGFHPWHSRGHRTPPVFPED